MKPFMDNPDACIGEFRRLHFVGHYSRFEFPAHARGYLRVGISLPHRGGEIKVKKVPNSSSIFNDGPGLTKNEMKEKIFFKVLRFGLFGSTETENYRWFEKSMI
jgi:hypothetical protein